MTDATIASSMLQVGEQSVPDVLWHGQRCRATILSGDTESALCPVEIIDQEGADVLRAKT